ncbi:YhgE/Pip domain-containing protein [Isoptericola halotolerans]|uniref:YhgE/Pip family protein n=1 Tax=Isoptericola halotolerans TaxID=300560 RepID=UPI00388E51B2
MRNSLAVLRRDSRRIMQVPKVWAIVIGMVVLPSMYAWLNIVAFWDPYGDTEAVQVAVVNLDEGASSEMTGELDVGDQIVEKLKQNDQLGWRFLGMDEAMDAVESGKVYAAFVVPKDFSSDLLSITTGTFVPPEIDFYTNEKANAIAPKITSAGASALDVQINSTFVSTVAKAVATGLENAGGEAETQLLDAKDQTLTALDDAVGKVEAARTGLDELDTAITDASSGIGAAEDALTEVSGTIGDTRSSISQMQTLVADAESDLVAFTDPVTTAYVSGATLLSDVSLQVNGAITTLAAGAQRANIEIGSAIADATAIADASGTALVELQDALGRVDPSAPGYQQLSDAVDQLQERHATDQQFLRDLGTLNTDVTEATETVQGAVTALDAAVQDSATSATSIRTVLVNTMPDLHGAMTDLSSSAGAFSSALDTQRELVPQAVDLLTTLESQMAEAGTAIQQLNGDLAGVETDLTNLRADVMALSSAEIWRSLSDLTELNPEEIATFMAAPVEVKQHTIYPVATYGSSMAPLFTNLGLWVGGFMLVVLLKQEVDTEKVPDLTIRQAYMGRWMLLAVLNLLQSLLMSVGNLAIGVQSVNAAAFVLTCVFVGQVYVAIIYALSVSLGYVGKGLAVLLVMVQIPGASGIYPIQMMPDFFRALFPLFPFAYGIDAMRETIGGFYDGYYWRYLAVLALFAALAFLLGILLRQRLGNFARLFNVKLAETGLFVSEDVQILGSRRRLSQLVLALTDRAEFEATRRRRAAWLAKHHLSTIRTAVLIGLGLTAILLVYGVVNPDAKATVLGLWGVVCLLVIGTIVALEYVRQSIGFARRVSAMPDDELQEALVREERATHSSTPLAELAGREVTR